MATVQGGWAAKNSSTFARTRRLRNTTRPDASAPCAWKTRFAMSNPIVLTCPTDASSSGRSTPPWHADAVRGRPSHHSRTIAVEVFAVAQARWGTGQKNAQPRLAFDQRQSTEVVAVEHQQVEGKQAGIAS